MSNIEWTSIEKPHQSHVNNIEFEFTGHMCGWDIRMHCIHLFDDIYWEVIVRNHHSNHWVNSFCTSRKEAEESLKTGLLMVIVCKLIGYNAKYNDKTCLVGQI